MSSTNIKKRYGITSTECIALHVARAILGVWREVYGEMNDEDAWARYQKLADDNNWSSHQRALACYLAFGYWEEVLARVARS